MNGLAPSYILFSISLQSEFIFFMIPTFFKMLCYSARPLNMEIHIQSSTIPHFPSLMIAMSKPAYLAILEYSPTKPVLVFVPSRRQCRLTVDLLTHCAADDEPEIDFWTLSSKSLRNILLM